LATLPLGTHVVLAPVVRPRRDAAARVPAVLVLRARAVLQPVVPGRGLEAAAQVRVPPAARAVRLGGERRRVRETRRTRRRRRRARSFSRNRANEKGLFQAFFFRERKPLRVDEETFTFRSR
jgi:hypothetical protein